LIRRTLLIATLICAAARAESLHLISPTDGAVLRGGHFTTLSWAAVNLGKNAEEWEAFLSVDGGRYYSVRLTPHLNINVRTFKVLVPNVDSDDVRLLFRTGNERSETIIEMPQRQRIRAEAIAVRPSATHARGPESARPNEPAVVVWSVGDHLESAAAPVQISTSKTTTSHSCETTLVSRAWHTLVLLAVRAQPGITRSPLAARCSHEIGVILQTSRMNV
jgi:hypothetical protein